MVIIMFVGLTFIAISVIVNLIEIKKFIRAVNLLNQCTNSFKDRMLYPVRLFKLLKLLSPIALDVVIMAVMGSAGLGGGTMGFILSLASSCAITLGIKAMLFFYRKQKPSTLNWEKEYQVLLESAK